MAVITPIYGSINEVLRGTIYDDLFIYNTNISADKFLFGGGGYDALTLPYSIDDFNIAFYVPFAQAAVLVKRNSSYSQYEYSAIYLDGIESIEFIDQSINLVDLAREQEGWDSETLTAFEPSLVVEGDFSTIAETLTYVNNNSPFAPGKGDATIIGSSIGTNWVYLSSFHDGNNIIQNGDKTTLSIDPWSTFVDNNIITAYDIDTVLFYEGAFARNSFNQWDALPSIDLLNITPNPEPEPGDNQENLGTITKGEIRVSDGTNDRGKMFDYYFAIEDQGGVYTYFELYDLEDDLDLTLYQLDGANNIYNRIDTSENPGVEDELIQKFLPEGDYILEVSYYEEILGNSQSNYEFSIDTKSFNDKTLLPNDEYFLSDQWYLFNTGQAGGIDDTDIFAPEAWKIRSTSPDVVVAVIDGGIQWDHPDLDDNIWINESEILGNNIDDDGNGYVDDYIGWNFKDDTNTPFPDGHGTHVAGTIGAEGNNSFGVTGVTWDVQLMSLDVFGNTEGASSPDQWEAIYYAVNNGADVINMSLGSTYLGSYQDFARELPEVDQAYKNAFEYAINRGTTVVIAAGNEDKSFDQNWFAIPAVYSDLYDGVISVAAVSNTGDLSYYSNYGSQVTIAAPGGDQSQSAGGGIYNTVPFGDYEYLQGTSMASPVVAGAVALMLGENPELTPAEVEMILQDSAKTYRSLEGLVEGGAFLDLAAAVAMAGDVIEPPTPEPQNPVYRLYNSSQGKHLFSSNQFEIDLLTGNKWQNEGVIYYAPEEGAADVFRFYIPTEGRHFYTALESERDFIIGNQNTFSGWQYEGAAFSAYSNSDYPDDAVAVVRYLNQETGSHVYSTSTYEQGILDQDSLWLNEGIAWYGDPMA